MIELKNITKTYKSKKGVTTKALDDVSLRFGDKGMVFILGKSGSGKSTLLNIIGGLDKSNTGEIIVFGKSNRTFLQKDFDSYRNTYVGFIFQEFHMLEDYNVYENIVLSLQLQQKEIEENKINDLLKKLELEDLKHRRINELSGGQKQRVAIARALIKDPKIILADEPTGNLDSKTGQQVMTLLKEISKDKLVIVVSHDKDFATHYGDRIIEVADGKITKDEKSITSSKEKDTKTYQAIEARLPLKESFALGLATLKHKKIKLCITMILTVIALLMFGIANTLSNLNLDSAHAKLLADKKEQFVQVEKFHYFEPGKYGEYDKENLEITTEELEHIKSITKKNSYPLYRLRNESANLTMQELLHIKSDNSTNVFYPDFLLSVQPDIIVANNPNEILKEKIMGHVPTKGNEIVISNALADSIIKNGIVVVEENEFSDETIFKPKDYFDLLNSNKTVYFGSKGQGKIVGIIEYDLSSCETIKGKEINNITTEEAKSLPNITSKSLNTYNKIYVHPDFVDTLTVEKIESLNKNYVYQMKIDNVPLRIEPYYTLPAIITKELTYYDGNRWVSTAELKQDEMILNVRQLSSFDEQDYTTKLTAYLDRYSSKNKEELEKDFFQNYVKEYDLLGKSVNLEVYKSRTVQYDSTTPDKKYENIKIVGLVGMSNTTGKQYNYFSSDLVEEFKIVPFRKVGSLIPTTTQKDFETILKQFPYNQELATKSTYTKDVNAVIDTTTQLKTLALWFGGGLFLFSILLISNFIVSSVQYRKKEMGILKALGARGIDIIKIFFWEGLIISVISGTIACLLLVVLTNILSNVILNWMIITPFVVGIKQFINIYLIVWIVTSLSSILPILRLSKMTPIDVIRNP